MRCFKRPITITIRYEDTNNGIITREVVQRIFNNPNQTIVIKVIIGEGILEISYNAFQDCPNIEAVITPDSLEVIGYRAFANFEKLKVFNFGQNLRKIEVGAFENCRILETVDLSLCTILKGLNERVFYGCESLTKVILPPNLQTIDSCLFYGCRSLREIAIPDSVTKLGHNVFNGCRNLTTMYANERRYGVLFFPESLESIGDRCFVHCRFLHTVIFHNGIGNIELGNNIFYNCPNLEYVLLPKSVRPHDLFPVDETPRYVFSSEPNPECDAFIQEQLESKRIKDKFRSQKQEFSECLNPKLRHPLSYSIIMSYMSYYNNTIEDNMEYSRYHRIVETILS